MTTTAQSGLAPVRRVLANGAVIIAKETRTTPAVTIHASFTAGSAYDPPSKTGLAHFVSRVIDRGTQRRTAEAIADELDGRGVSLAVSVNRHAASIVATCLIEDFDAILALLADIVVHPAFVEDEIATRRAEIATLIRQDEDNPSVVATEGLLTALYGGIHPYGWRPRGTSESVEAITRDDLLMFHSARYGPSTLSLVIVGDVDPHRAVASAAGVLEEWPSRAADAVAFPAIPPRLQREVRVIPMMSKAQADIAYGFVTIERSAPSYYAYWLMNNILGQYSLGGRLGDSIRERGGMAYYVFSSFDANVTRGPLMIRAGVNPSNVDRAVSSIDAELMKLRTDGPTEREITESKQYLIGSMPRTLETNVGIASFLQMTEFFHLGQDYDVRVPSLLRAVTRDHVHEAAQSLDPTRAAIVIAGPYTRPA